VDPDGNDGGEHARRHRDYQRAARPQATAFLPKRTSAPGASVIIAPGGGFVALAIDREGSSVARWLQDKGIAAFVLKYRTVEKRGEGIPAMDQDVAAQYGIADGIQAIKGCAAARRGVGPRA
jgi:acetyl esterase/lipase